LSGQSANPLLYLHFQLSPPNAISNFHSPADLITASLIVSPPSLIHWKGRSVSLFCRMDGRVAAALRSFDRFTKKNVPRAVMSVAWLFQLNKGGGGRNYKE
jgi:hypothetical protein